MELGNNEDPEIGPAQELYLQFPYGELERRYYFTKGRPLYKAARKGKWEDVSSIFQDDENAGRAYITEGNETPLHISALANNVEFVRKLLTEVNAADDLAILNKKGNTALCLAAANGNVVLADLLIQRNNELPNIRGRGSAAYLPVMLAAELGNGEMVKRLLPPTTDLAEEEKLELLKKLIASDLLVIAGEMIDGDTRLASDASILEMLATKPMAERTKKGIWKTTFCFGMKEADSPQIQALELLDKILKLVFEENNLNIASIVELAPRLLFDAAKQGNFHLFKSLIDYYPELVWKINEVSLSMFHVAVKYRHESIFALLYDMDEVRKLVTTYEEKIEENNTGNNMLHLAATLAPPEKLNTINGAAFQMQQAICWYKAVEKIVPPSFRDKKNDPCRDRENANGETPGDIFDTAHKDLLKQGEKWTKDTAKSCMVVAALTATVIFQSAFTVPGGNDDKGHPHFLNRAWFDILTVTEVIGMLSSSTSILMFLSILTSRVNKYAFQSSLPYKLFFGVLALSVSIASMIIAFCAAIYLSYGHSWVAGLLLLLACVPIVFIISLKSRLLFDLYHYTFRMPALFR